MKYTFEARATATHYKCFGEDINLNQENNLRLAGEEIETINTVLVSEMYSDTNKWKAIDAADAALTSVRFGNIMVVEFAKLGIGGMKDGKAYIELRTYRVVKA